LGYYCLEESLCENAALRIISKWTSEVEIVVKRFVQEHDRTQTTLFPERLEDYISPENPIRVVDAFVEGLDLKKTGFDRVIPKSTDRVT